MSEDAKFADPNEYEPVSNQLANANKTLGAAAVENAEYQKDRLEGKSLLYKINPLNFYNSDKKWWKQASEENQTSREKLNQEVSEYIDGIHEEAANYVTAYEEYTRVLIEFGKISGADMPQQKMNSFIEEMGHIGENPNSRYDTNANKQQGESETQTELFKKYARLTAVKDFFEPRMPLDPEEKKNGYDMSFFQLGEGKYRSSWPEQRLMRRDIGTEDKARVLEDAQRMNSPGILELSISSDIPEVLDGELTEKRYVALSEMASKVIDEFPSELNGSESFYAEHSLAISRMPRPAFTIMFGGKVTSVAEFEEKKNEPQISVVLEYDLEEASGTRPQRVELAGSLEDVRELAARTVVAEEWSLGSEMNLVHGARVTLPDGTQKTWHEFIQPSEESKSKEEKAEVV